MTNESRLLPQEAAAYLGCGYDKLMQMTRRKEIPFYSIGKRKFFRKKTLDLWIENQERQSIQMEVGSWSR